jgi:hypothetical protein
MVAGKRGKLGICLHHGFKKMKIGGKEGNIPYINNIN